MKIIIVLLFSLYAAGAAGAAPAKPKAAETQSYGALAVDRSKNFVYGFGYDHPDRATANDRAMKECTKRKGNCAVVVEFSGKGCASYATIAAGKGDAYGWGTDKTMDGAKKRALGFCEKFSEGAACSNHVWSCNGKGLDRFNVEREDPITFNRACYVQFEAQLDRTDNDNWAGRFYSPVYQYKAEDCPKIGDKNESIYGGGAVYYDNLPSYKAADNAKVDPSGRSQKMTEEFYKWLVARQSPYANVKFRTVGSSTVTSAKPELLKELTKRNEQLDSGMTMRVPSIPGAVPTCLDFKPSGITPVEVHGTAGCQRWVR